MTRKPTALFIIDRVKHWSSRAWIAVNSAAAYQHAGGRVIVLVDCPKDSNYRTDVVPREVLKPDLIIQKASEQNLNDFLTLPIGRKRPEVWRATYWNAARQLARFIDQHEVDILHIHRRTHHLTAYLAAMWAKRPIAIVRGCARADRTLESGFPHTLFYRRLDAVTGFTQGMTEKNRSISGISPEVCHELPVGIPRPYTDRRYTREEGKQKIKELFGIEGDQIVGLIGAIEQEKRPEDAVAAAQLLRSKYPNMKMILVGQQSPQRSQHVIDLIAEHGLHDMVKMFPSQKSIHIPAVLAGLEVGLYIARRSSGPSRMVLEKMSQGTPLVATNIAAIPEYHARDPKAFIMVPKESVEDIAEGIDRILSNPGLAADMSQRGYDLIQRDFTFERLSERLNRIYSYALAHRGIELSAAVANPAT